jgi:undecaprenyl-diphosphatase
MTEPLIPITSAEKPATRRPPWLLVIGAAIAGALWLLLYIASDVRRGELLSFDRALMLAMRVPGQPAVPAGPPWLPEMMRDVTALGGVTVLTGVILLTLVFLLLKRLYRPAALVLIATISGSWAIAAIKVAFARPRPTLTQHLMDAAGASFPSGHSGNSAIVYFTLASLIFPVIRETRIRLFMIITALLLVGAIGVSRVYLGVHWPSDVLAGWTFGALWALMWWAIEAKLLARRAFAPTPAHP